MNYLLNFDKFVSTQNVEKIKNKETDIEDVNKKKTNDLLSFDAFFDKLLMIEKKSNNLKMIKE